MRFNQYILLEFFREVQDAVKHIDHLEENVLTFGKSGVKKTLDYIENIIEYFVGTTQYKITTKFDGCIHPDTKIITSKGEMSIIDLVNTDETVLIKCFNEKTQRDVWVEALHPRINNNNKKWVLVELEDGSQLKCTEDHEIFTLNRGWIPAGQLTSDDELKSLTPDIT